MSMPIATQVADAITTIKGRLYAKAGELYFRKSGNGTVYQLTPPGGGGGPVLDPVVRAPGVQNLNAGELALCDNSGDYAFTLINGVADGDQCGIISNSVDGVEILVSGNIGGNPPNYETGYQYRAAVYIWSADQSLWYLYSLVLRPVA